MKSYNEKDLSGLSSKTKIILRGSILFSVTKDFVKKIASKAVKTVNKINDFNFGKVDNFVEQSTKDELLDKKIDNIEATQDALFDTYDNVMSNNINNKAYYLKNITDLYIKLENKRISYISNGLNKYSLPKLVLMQFKKNAIKSVNVLKQSVSDKKDQVVEKVSDLKDAVVSKIEDFKPNNSNVVTNVVSDNVVTNVVNDNDDKTYSQILDTLKQSIDCRSKLEDFRRSNPQVYDKVMQDLDLANNKNNAVDDDFIEEIGPRVSSR